MFQFIPQQYLRRLFTILSITLYTFTAATGVSIEADRELLLQRKCVQACFGEYSDYNLWDAVGCPNANECICRPDIRPLVSKWLSKCIFSTYESCSDGTDIAIGTSIYNRYCTFDQPATVFVTPTPTLASTARSSPRPQDSPVTVTLSVTSSFSQVTLFRTSPRLDDGTIIVTRPITIYTPAPTVAVVTLSGSSSTKPPYLLVAMVSSLFSCLFALI